MELESTFLPSSTQLTPFTATRFSYLICNLGSDVDKIAEAASSVREIGNCQDVPRWDVSEWNPSLS